MLYALEHFVWHSIDALKHSLCDVLTLLSFNTCYAHTAGGHACTKQCPPSSLTCLFPSVPSALASTNPPVLSAGSSPDLCVPSFPRCPSAVFWVLCHTYGVRTLSFLGVWIESSLCSVNVTA